MSEQVGVLSVGAQVDPLLVKRVYSADCTEAVAGD